MHACTSLNSGRGLPHSKRLRDKLLLLIFGFALFSAFALPSQSVRSAQLTLKALAHQLDLALEEDLPWSLWFLCG